MAKSKRTLPEIEFNSVLFCPHCGTKLFVYDEPYIGRCPHLILAYAWGPEDMILAIRPDYAKILLEKLVKSKSYKTKIKEGELEPLTEELKIGFLEGNIDPDDNIALKLAEYFPYPHINFPLLLPECSAVYKDSGLYSGVHLILSSYTE